MKNFGIYEADDSKLGYFYNPKGESGVGIEGLSQNKSYIKSRIQDVITYLFLKTIYSFGVRENFIINNHENYN